MLIPLLTALLAAQPHPDVAVVEALYQAFPWEGESVLSAPHSTLAQYFDAELMGLLDEDAACSQKHQAICNLNGDPIYNAQDAQITALKVTPGTTAGEVVVEFHNFGEPQKLVHRLVDTPQGRRIHDIVYAPDQSLRGWLTSPVEFD